jgi:hypothetical protein
MTLVATNRAVTVRERFAVAQNWPRRATTFVSTVVVRILIRYTEAKFE